jgi:hypothetical protein
MTAFWVDILTIEKKMLLGKTNTVSGSGIVSFIRIDIGDVRCTQNLR